VMWRADVIHYRRHGTTVTGQKSYIRMPQGPVPNFVHECLSELKAEGKIAEQTVETLSGVRRQFVWLEKRSAVDFAPTEVEVLHEAIDLVCAMTAARASEQTYDCLWDEIENGQQISVRAAAVQVTDLEPTDIEWALSQAANIN
jgi:Protein of unknown function (DUF4065)